MTAEQTAEFYADGDEQTFEPLRSKIGNDHLLHRPTHRRARRKAAHGKKIMEARRRARYRGQVAAKREARS